MKECIKITRKEKKASQILPYRIERVSWVRGWEGIFSHSQLARNWNEREKCLDRMFLLVPQGTRRNKGSVWTSCHLGPSSFMIGQPQSWAKLIRLPWGSLLDCGSMSEIGDGHGVTGLSWSPWRHILRRTLTVVFSLARGRRWGIGRQINKVFQTSLHFHSLVHAWGYGVEIWGLRRQVEWVVHKCVKSVGPSEMRTLNRRPQSKTFD